MTSTKSDPPLSPEAILLRSNTGWKVRRSAWTLWALLSCGLLSCIGFGYVALKTQRRSWWAISAFWALVSAGTITYITLTEEARTAGTESSGSEAIGTVLIVLGLVSMVHAFILNPRWLTWAAADQANKNAVITAARNAHRGNEGAIANSSPTTDTLPPEIRALRTDQAEFYGSGPSVTPTMQTPSETPQQHADPSAQIDTAAPAPLLEKVDINTATAEALSSATGIDARRSEQIIAERQQHGYFTSVEDFGLRSGLTPVELHRISSRLTFDQPTRPPPSDGRFLDL